MTARRMMVCVLVWWVVACSEGPGVADFERMLDQPRQGAYQPALGGYTRRPPPLTVPQERDLSDDVAESTDVIGVSVDAELLFRGRDRFERFCGACHGPLGFGQEAVVRHMTERPAPSLHEPRIVSSSAGHIYRTIRDGYGAMPSYARELDHRDRWAVVAYVRVLWRSQATRLADLPPEVRAHAREVLP